MTIGRYLDISTAHVTKQDMDLLIAAAGGHTSTLPVLASYQEGIFAYADPDADFDAFRNEGISESFIKVLRYAIAHDCYLVRLDCDAYWIENDPSIDTHSW